MNAGRELDALVAEKVMGMEVSRDPDGSVMRVIDGMTDWSIEYDVPCYSRDIAAAWQVFQVMMGRLFSTRNAFFAALQEQTRLPTGEMAGGLWALQVLKDRFPEAICLAALAAVRTEVPA